MPDCVAGTITLSFYKDKKAGGGAGRVERRGGGNMLGGGLLAQPGDLEGIHPGRNLG